MATNLQLSEDEKDFLREFMNVAYGSATAVLAEMLDAYATLSIPQIEVMNHEELRDALSSLAEGSYFFATQPFLGDFSGEIAFFMDDDSAHNLAKHFELEGDDEVTDAIMELTNVMSSTLVSKLCEQMESEVTFSHPNVQKLESHELANSERLDAYSEIIVIQTEIKFEDQKISGHILILTKDESVLWLKQTIQNLLELLML